MTLKVYMYQPKHRISQLCLWYFKKRELEIVESPQQADVAFAPRLSRKLQLKGIEQPKIGTLIFHPSLLPRHRGGDAIGWAFRFGEKYTGATWYWLNDELYRGDICEILVLGIQRGESAEAFYERAIVPAAVKMLFFILNDLTKGIIRRRPQEHESATYEPSLLIEDEED